MAPRKRGGGGRGGGLSFIFCCFNSSDHPEITYRLREDFALQAMEPSLPMPGYDELDGMFSELVVRQYYYLFLLLRKFRQSNCKISKEVLNTCNSKYFIILIRRTCVVMLFFLV